MAATNVEDDWRSSCSSLVQQWGLARRKNFHTDVNFVVGEGKTAVPFSAHKIVLAFGSPVFEAMFYGQLAETKNPISIVDIDAETFEILLRYFYAEKIKFTSFVSAAKAYFAAEKYLIDRLKTAADDYMSRTNMKESQFWEIIQQEKYFHISAIKTKYLDYFSKIANTLLNSKMLLNLSLDVMRAIVDLDCLNASEYELLSAVSGWVQGSSTAETKIKMKFLLPYIRFSNLSTEEFSNFDESNRGIIQGSSTAETKIKMKFLLPYIRFSNLSTEEFSNFDESHPGIIGSGDSLAILKHLCNPSKFMLPQWCSTKTGMRSRRNNEPPIGIRNLRYLQ